MLTGACCWLFWLCCYMSQMNPLIGPVLETKALFAMKREWGGADEDSAEEIDGVSSEEDELVEEPVKAKTKKKQPEAVAT